MKSLVLSILLILAVLPVLPSLHLAHASSTTNCPNSTTCFITDQYNSGPCILTTTGDDGNQEGGRQGFAASGRGTACNGTGYLYAEASAHTAPYSSASAHAGISFVDTFNVQNYGQTNTFLTINSYYYLLGTIWAGGLGLYFSSGAELEASFKLCGPSFCTTFVQNGGQPWSQDCNPAPQISYPPSATSGFCNNSPLPFGAGNLTFNQIGNYPLPNAGPGTYTLTFTVTTNATAMVTVYGASSGLSCFYYQVYNCSNAGGPTPSNNCPAIVGGSPCYYVQWFDTVYQLTLDFTGNPDFTISPLSSQPLLDNYATQYAPAIDGTGANYCYNVSSCSASVTTTKGNDLIIATGYVYSNCISSSPSLTWTLRRAQGYLQEYYAVASSAGTYTISLQGNGGSGCGSQNYYGPIAAFAVSGSALSFDRSVLTGQTCNNDPTQCPTTVTYNVNPTYTPELIFMIGASGFYQLYNSESSGLCCFVIAQSNQNDLETVMSEGLMTTSIEARTLQMSFTQTGIEYFTIVDAIQGIAAPPGKSTTPVVVSSVNGFSGYVSLYYGINPSAPAVSPPVITLLVYNPSTSSYVPGPNGTSVYVTTGTVANVQLQVDPCATENAGVCMNGYCSSDITDSNFCGQNGPLQPTPPATPGSYTLSLEGVSGNLVHKSATSFPILYYDFSVTNVVSSYSSGVLSVSASFENIGNADPIGQPDGFFIAGNGEISGYYTFPQNEGWGESVSYYLDGTLESTINICGQGYQSGFLNNDCAPGQVFDYVWNTPTSSASHNITITVTETLAAVWNTHGTLLDINPNNNHFAADFGLVPMSNSALQSTPGSSVATTVTVASLPDFSGTVSISGSAPSGWGLSFNTTSVNLNPAQNKNVTATISPPLGTSAGNYAVTMTGTGPFSTHSINIIVLVSGFQMSLNPMAVGEYCNPLGCPYSITTTSSLTVTSIGGFSGTVSLSYIAPSPSGGTSVTGPSSVFIPVGGTATVTLSATLPTQRNTDYYWTIRGQSGTYDASATLDVYYHVCTKNCPVATTFSTPTISTPVSATPSSTLSTSYTLSYTYNGDIMNAIMPIQLYAYGETESLY